MPKKANIKLPPALDETLMTVMSETEKTSLESLIKADARNLYLSEITVDGKKVRLGSFLVKNYFVGLAKKGELITGEDVKTLKSNLGEDKQVLEHTILGSDVFLGMGKVEVPDDDSGKGANSL